MIIEFVPSRAAMIGFIQEHYPGSFSDDGLAILNDNGIRGLWSECVHIQSSIPDDWKSQQWDDHLK